MRPCARCYSTFFLLLCRNCSLRCDTSKLRKDDSILERDSGMEQDIDILLNDPSKRAIIIQRLQSGTVSHLTPSGMVRGSKFLTPGGMPLHPSGMFLTTSGTFPPPNGAFAWPPTWYSFSAGLHALYNT